ncbi:hypothetical protein H0H93_016479 [Arthromyces matolae]|nr:hypothetical protein H0H93_016479 [Arthromyces matolae]
MNDLTKALAHEVQILLEEVGKLRDERRTLQFEIAELMQLKSKHGAGGEYAPNWRPPMPLLEGPPPPDAQLALELAPPVQARPGWRTVHPQPDRRKRTARTVPKAITQGQPPAGGSIPPPGAPAGHPMAAQGHGGGRRPAFATPPLPEPQVPAWTQWRPNPLIAPTPDNSVMMSPPPVSPPAPARGLFGPRTPPPS